MFSGEFRKFLILFSSVAAVVFVLFGPSLGGQFTLDDHSVIEKGLQNKSFTENVFEVWVSPWHPGGQWAGNYRPLTSLSFAFNLIFSDSPVGFRVINILLYALNVIFVYYLVRRLSSERTAYLTAVLFLFLPIHSEVVMSVVGRVYLLGTLFSLASLYYFLDKKYWASSGFFLLALFSGDIFISLLLITGILLLLEHKSFVKAFKAGMVYAVGLPAYFLLRYLALGEYAFGGYGFINPIIGPLAFVSIKERIFTALVHLYLYLRKTVWPVDLSPDYSFNQVPTVSNIFLSWRSLAGLAFLALLAHIFYKSKRKDVRFAVVLFAAPYLVISNIFFITTGVMAERWWYFPSLGLVMLAAAAVESFKEKVKNPAQNEPSLDSPSRRGGRGSPSQTWRQNFKINDFASPKDLRSQNILSLLTLYFLLLTLLVWYSVIIFNQNKAWLSDRALFIHAAARSSNSVWARTNVAEGYFLSGEADKAREEIEATLKISDEYPLTLYVLGQIHWKEGEFGEAENAFQRALEFDAHGRNKRSFYRSMALVNFDIGNNKKALEYMLEAVKWPPAGDLKNILEVDEFLLKKMEEYADRDPRSYSEKEIQELGQMIKALRGF